MEAEENNRFNESREQQQMEWELHAKTYVRGLYPGPVPLELSVLTLVETSMISLYNPITRISMGKVSFYHGKGNMFSIVNDITRVATSLPSMPTIDEFAVLRYVKDGEETELKYRSNRVRNALNWLKQNNHLYQNVIIVYPEAWNHLQDLDHSIEIESMPVDEEDAALLKEALADKEEIQESNVSTNTGDLFFSVTFLLHFYICNIY